MMMPNPHFAVDSNLKCYKIKADSGRFASIADCMQHCLPALRACAGLFYGSREGGDELIEHFIADVLVRAADDEGDLATPAGLSRALEQHLRGQFGDRPQRIALASSPCTPRGVWMSVDEFFATLGHL